MLEHVWERAIKSRYVSDVVVATDDERIASAVRQFGGRARMTRPDHPTGTDRLAEVASAEEAALYVNIQGDEPLIDPDAIDAAILSVNGDESVSMGTLKKQIVDPTEILNTNVVKVVTNLLGDAIYFSRCPIPYERDGRNGLPVYFKHIGLYVYRRDFLLRYPDLTVGPLEEAERLEQLRALENGYRIRVVNTEYESLGVDTPADLKRLNDLFAAAKEKVGILRVRAGTAVWRRLRGRVPAFSRSPARFFLFPNRNGSQCLNTFS
jgi:3-deoxy-manno-octulosonate cytidylyltransferase (CMP-KDO synthetase)